MNQPDMEDEPANLIGSKDKGDLEILSQIDPNDEFLKSENSFSLIEKLSQS